MDEGLTDIALRGLEAARALVDRFVRAIDDPAPTGGEVADVDPASVEGLAGVWAGALRSAAAAWDGQSRPGTPDGQAVPPTLRVGGAGGVVLPLSIAPDDTTGVVELWLHNPTTSELPHVAVSVGALRCAGGDELAPDVVRVTPAAISPLPERSSRGITLQVTIPAGTPADRYRGVVLVDGVPDAWALLDVEVR